MLTLTPGLPSAPVNPRAPDAPYGVDNSKNNDEGGIWIPFLTIVIGKLWWFNGDLMGFNGDLIDIPSGYVNIAIENGP